MTLLALPTARASNLIHDHGSDLHYPQDVPADRNALGDLADLIRTARIGRGWTQDQLADAAEISRPTVQRYEQAKTTAPQPAQLRAIFRALGLDPRRIPVILGYVTADEMGLPPEPPRPALPADVEALAALLEDPDIPPAAKADLVEQLRLSVRQTRNRRAG